MFNVYHETLGTKRRVITFPYINHTRLFHLRVSMDTGTIARPRIENRIFPCISIPLYITCYHDALLTLYHETVVERNVAFWKRNVAV